MGALAFAAERALWEASFVRGEPATCAGAVACVQSGERVLEQLGLLAQ